MVGKIRADAVRVNQGPIMCRRSARQCIARLIRLRSTLHPPPGSGSFAFMISRPENCFAMMTGNSRTRLVSGNYDHKQHENQLEAQSQPVNLPSFSMLQQESVRFESGCLGYHKKKSDESDNPSQRGENDFRDGQRLNCSLRLFIGSHPSRRKIVTAVATNCIGWIDKLTDRACNHGALGGFGDLPDYFRSRLLMRSKTSMITK